MTRRMFVTAAVAVSALLVPVTALGKGASQATITGPGLGSAITLAGEGQIGGRKLALIAEEAGFFPSVFLSTPSPMHSSRPSGELGPRYRIVYEMPGPSNELDRIRQDIYPYATPTPVTYMTAGQSYFTTEETVGGWYVASAALKDALVDVGLPQSPPPVGNTHDGAPWATLVGATVGAGLVITALLGIRARRRESPATV
jgi:hypothetical protein